MKSLNFYYLQFYKTFLLLFTATCFVFHLQTEGEKRFHLYLERKKES